MKSNALTVGAMELGARLQAMESRGLDEDSPSAPPGAIEAVGDYRLLVEKDACPSNSLRKYAVKLMGSRSEITRLPCRRFCGSCVA